MEITLYKEQIGILNSNNKLYSNLSGTMSLAKFLVGNNEFTFSLMGDAGAVNTKIPCSTSDSTYLSFSMPFSKWNNTLQKFSKYSNIHLHITSKSLRVSTDDSSDEATFAINRYVEFEDAESIVYENAVTQIKSNTKSFNEIFINEDFATDLDLMRNMFSIQSNGNTIGIGKNTIMYADGSLIVKAKLTDSVPEEFFKDTKDDYVFVSNDIIKLICSLYSRSNVFRFTSNYDAIYWYDEHTELYYQGSVQKSDLPSEEDFNNFKPSIDTAVVSIPCGTLRESIKFFDGVFDNNDWKLLKFSASKDKGFNLVYSDKDATVNYTKHVDDVECTLDSTFTLSADAVIGIAEKAMKKFSVAENINITYNNDPDTISVLITVADSYEAVLVKLEE